MEHNYTTFEESITIFKKDGIVLIFSEGRCINEWHLRSLMKGTARLALSSWEKGVPLKILPVGINYQSFVRFGKNIDLNFGTTFTQKDIDINEGFGRSVQAFNERLNAELKPLVYDFEKEDQHNLRYKFHVKIPLLTKLIFFVPAVAGFIIHLPLYFFVKMLATKFGDRNDHYDSIAVGALFLFYPLYLALIFSLCFLFFGKWSLLIFMVSPACGWCYMQLKKQF